MTGPRARQPSAALLLLALACGAAGAPAGAAPVPASPVHAGTQPSLRLALRETRGIYIAGASAVFSLDTAIVEATLRQGRLVLVARQPGAALVSIVTPRGIETLAVTVERPPPRVAAAAAPAGGQRGTAEIRFDSGARRAGLALELQSGSDARGARVRVQAVHDRSGAHRPMALPAASIELRDGERRVTLLDEFVQASPLTLDHAMLRGVHAGNGRTQVHAGVSSTQPWDDLVLPAQGDRALSIAHRIPRGGSTWVPRLLWLPDSDASVPGVASLGVERGDATAPFSWRGELGWSGRIGAAVEAQWRRPGRSGWIDAAWKPREFAALDTGRPSGTWVEGAWNEALAAATLATFDVSASALDLEGQRHRAASARTNVQHRLAPGLELELGAGASDYRAGERRSQRITSTLGARAVHGGTQLQAQYRYQYDRVGGATGHGGRLAAHAARDGWRAHVYVDAQQNAATLDVLLPPGSMLARLFAELGLGADSPEDVLRLLREYSAAFEQHGLRVGEMRVDPLRVQAGAEIAWTRREGWLAQLGARWRHDESAGALHAPASTLATLFAAWRVTERTRLETSVSRWDAGGLPAERSFQLALRTAFSGLDWPGRARAIEGRVRYQDGSPAADVEIVLDGARRLRTDREGAFAFDRVAPGRRRVEALLGAGTRGYFRDASQRSVQAGDTVVFELIAAPALVTGTVASDAGLPLAGVTIAVEGAVAATAVTDSSGHYRVAVPAGTFRVGVSAESVPPGYELRALAPLTLETAPGAPARGDFRVAAQRSVQGELAGAPPGVRVRALPSNRAVTLDPAGRFVLRQVPPGTLTLRVTTGRGSRDTHVSVPAGPGRVSGVRLELP